MCKLKTVSVLVICMVAALLAGSTQAVAQETEGRARAEQLVNNLKQTVPYERGSVMGEIQALGPVAVKPLTGVVKGWKAQGDRAFVSCCMILLGRLGKDARPATDALVEALESSSSHIRFSAAKALGEIWKGERKSNRAPVKLNGALTSALYSAVYERGGAEVFGPVMALKKINDIPVDKGKEANISSLPAVNLRRQVGRWIARHPEVLPEFKDQSWQLLLAYIMQRPDSEKAKKAKNFLIRRQPLSAIRSITEVCLWPQIRVGSKHWQRLADILTGLTKIEMPRKSDKDAAELVTEWRRRWLKSLQNRTTEKYRRYALNKLDSLIAEARENPSQEILDTLDMMKVIILKQLESPEQLPDNISPDARRLLVTSLEIKARFAKTLGALQEHEEAHRVLQDAKTLQRIAAMKSGKLVAKQYLDELTTIARKEQRIQILAVLGRLLRDVTGVPIVLTNVKQEKKEKRLDEWLQQVQKTNEDGREGKDGE